MSLSADDLDDGGPDPAGLDWIEGVGEQEVEADCPNCGAAITLLLDLSVRRQAYIEDCEICCRPIVISYVVRDDLVDDLRLRTEDDL